MAQISKSERIKWEESLHIYKAALEVLQAKIKIVKIEYDNVAEKSNNSDIQMITNRIKKIESIASKLENKNLEFTVENINNNIHDVVGCRIVCLTLSDVALLNSLLRNSLNETVGFTLEKEKDYINNPKPSGYQSYHFRVKVPVTFSNKTYEVPAEIQVRTLLMHAWAELEHKLGYKPITEMQEGELIKTQFNSLSSAITATDLIVERVLKEDTKKR